MVNRLAIIKKIIILGLLSAGLCVGWTGTGLSKSPEPKELVQAKAAARVKQFEKAASLLGQLAQKGNAEAQFQLAGLYRAGTGVTKSHATAVRWLKIAAEKGHADAQYQLGVMYEQGWGVPVDQHRALQWYEAAARQAHEKAWQKYKSIKLLQVKRANDPTHRRIRALQEATIQGNPGKVRELLKQGTDIHARDPQGRTPLILALENNQTQVARVLLQAGADFTDNDPSGHNPLTLAVSRRDMKSVYLLIQEGMNPNGRDVNGDIPLHMALKEGNVLMVKTLVHLGADIHIPDKKGKTAEDLARRSNDKRILKVIKSAREMEKARAAIRQKKFQKAAGLLKLLAGKGNAESQYQLASLYRSGHGVPKDHATAARWLRKSADQGHAAAQYNLGIMYENGWGGGIQTGTSGAGICVYSRIKIELLADRSSP